MYQQAFTTVLVACSWCFLACSSQQQMHINNACCAETPSSRPWPLLCLIQMAWFLFYKNADIKGVFPFLQHTYRAPFPKSPIHPYPEYPLGCRLQTLLVGLSSIHCNRDDSIVKEHQSQKRYQNKIKALLKKTPTFSTYLFIFFSFMNILENMESDLE